MLSFNERRKAVNEALGPYYHKDMGLLDIILQLHIINTGQYCEPDSKDMAESYMDALKIYYNNWPDPIPKCKEFDDIVKNLLLAVMTEHYIK